MRCSYNSGFFPYCSSIERTWEAPQDWTHHGAGTCQRWGIGLRQFSLAGVDLKRIVNLAILMGDPIAHQQGGSGKLFIDDIRLTDLAP